MQMETRKRLIFYKSKAKEDLVNLYEIRKLFPPRMLAERMP
jgi:hypothetical protein